MKLLTMVVEMAILPLCTLHDLKTGFGQQVFGHGRGGQTLDLIACATQVLEKGRDRQNCAAVTALDVRSFHDSVPFGVALRGLRHRGICADWARAAIRLHRCPKYSLQVGGARTRLLKRQRGVTTGNPLAALFGKVIMQDILEYVKPELLPSVFRIEDKPVLPMIWSDNIVCFARSESAGAELLLAWQKALWSVARCEVKEGS